MSHHNDPRYLYCTRVARNVGVCRSEAECRAEFGCTKPNCPLEKHFGFQAFDQRMQAFATIFDLWPVRGTPFEDFP